MSWKPDPEAEEEDAFTLNWSQLRGYAFPPFALIGRCLRASSAAVSLSVDNCGSTVGNSAVVLVVIGNDGGPFHITPILFRTAETTERSTSLYPPLTSRMTSLRSRYEGLGVLQPA